MNKRELEFRKALIKAMRGTWIPTIHVENHLNPGVPDLSFVLHSPGVETGWLELKAMAYSWPLRITVEPGQHSWMEAHAHKVPAYFLIEVSGDLHLIHGRHHGRLSTPISPDDLAGLSFRKPFTINDRTSIFSALRAVTYRGRLDSA